MLRDILTRLPLLDRPPRVPIRNLDTADQALLVVGVVLSAVVGFIVAVATLYVLGLGGVINSQGDATGDFALILWASLTYLLALVVLDWSRQRLIRREQRRRCR